MNSLSKVVVAGTTLTTKGLIAFELTENEFTNFYPVEKSKEGGCCKWRVDNILRLSFVTGCGTTLEDSKHDVMFDRQIRTSRDRLFAA